ncbi:hypothetical protein H5410_027178 [Solanum commersonii]|uniref:DUF1985 domain-containing protein n=1 Tax=Solanum commersonii TaxID=4109 RepID=A0A9J5Z3N8_SOLCO|nr:hypothetical protein H5410_027178 [Solanum commersonii]
MSKKKVVTPRKSPRLVKGTSTDEVQSPSFNILSQTPPPKIVETPPRGGSSLLKDQKEKNNEAKKRVTLVNQKGKKRKGKIVETPSDSDFVKVAQSSKPSTIRTTKKNESEIPRSKKDKKIQCQLLRHLLLLESENVKDDMFIVKINGTELHFGIKEFVAVTGLKCGLLTDFVLDPSIPNRLITKYFGEKNKVPKLDFLNKFKEDNLFEPEDRFKIGVLYCISTFFTGSKASKTTIPKLYFDLVESGQYMNFPWGNECFRLTLKACRRRLGNNPTSFKFSQFHIALQIWFYECCHLFDNTVAIRVATGTPHILNWKTSNESIFFDDLKNTIFRTYGNQIIFYLLKSSNIKKGHVDFDEKYVELKKEIAEVDKHMTELKAYVDNSTKLIIDKIRSRAQPTQTTQQEDDAHQHVEESEKAPMDQPSVSMREYVDMSNTDAEAQNSIDQTVGGVFNADIPGSSTSKPPTLDGYPDLTMTQIIELDPILNANTTPDVQPRNRNPEKYDTSPYIRLLEGESSLRGVPIFFRIKHPFESHNRFEVEAELIDEVNKWIFKDVSSRRGRKSAYSKLKDNFEPQMDFGVVKVSEKDFFNIMVKFDRPWEDGINVGQCIRGFKLLANISWDSVDDVIIPVNISEKFHWLLVVFRIKLRCLHVYDSISGGSVHTNKVNEAVGKLATTIPLFLMSMRFYGKRLDLYANKLLKYVHKSHSTHLISSI